MIEVYYHQPQSEGREHSILTVVSAHRGVLTFRETVENAICLTIEFPSWEAASQAAKRLRVISEHVEGPTTYGDD